MDPTPPRLTSLCNLWTLWDHPPGGRAWSLERKIAAIKDAGFDGFSCLLDRSHGKLAERYGLRTVGYISSSDPKEFRALVARNIEGGAVRINVQLGDHDTPVAKAVKMAIQMVAEGDKQGVPCDIEVHRDTCTETPEKLYAIVDEYRQATGRLLPVTWDFSHLAVIKHLAPPYWPRLLVRPPLVQHARQFHFRPFNGHHCQVPVTNAGRGRSIEFKQWWPTVERTLQTWLAVNQNGNELFVCPEMGPVRGGYNLSALPNSWEDCKVLRREIAAAWRIALKSYRYAKTRSKS